MADSEDGDGCGYIPLVLASFVAAMLAELSGAALGFGPAILYQIFWQLCFLLGLSSGLLETAVFNIVVEEAPCSFVQLYLLREHFDLRLAILFNLPVLAGLPLGTMVLEHFGRSLYAKYFMGTVFAAIAGLQVLQRHLGVRDELKPRRSIEERSPRVATAIVLAMFSSGFLRGMLGVAGPPAMVLLLFFSTDRAVWRCTAAAARVFMIVSQGLLLGGYHEALKPECWIMYLSLMAGGMVGLLVGNALAPLVDQTAFQRWLLLFLLSGAMLMLSDGNPAFSALTAVFTALAAVAAACVPAAMHCRRRAVEFWDHHRVASGQAGERQELPEAAWTQMSSVEPIVTRSGRSAGELGSSRQDSEEGPPGQLGPEGRLRPDQRWL